jgi:Reverse transcriptase (RNA-dependent DNA polymerase)
VGSSHALAAKANAEDNPTWEQAMNGPEWAGYWKAMEVELHTLEVEKDSWEVVDHEPWMNVLPGTWAFKCKRYPDGSIRKLKARFCVRGDKQVEGVDFFDTYAPVVNWQTVRLMLVLSIMLGLYTKQVDYTAAFVHAPIDRDPNWDNIMELEKE